MPFAMLRIRSARQALSVIAQRTIRVVQNGLMRLWVPVLVDVIGHRATFRPNQADPQVTARLSRSSLQCNRKDNGTPSRYREARSNRSRAALAVRSSRRG